PDNRHFLFYASGAPAVSGIYVGELGTMVARRLIEADAPAVLASPNHILYVRDSTLFIHHIRTDAAGVTLVDSPVRIADDVPLDRLAGVAGLSAAAGTIIYRTGPPVGKRQFVWVDSSGHELQRIGSPEAAAGAGLSLSRNQARIATQRTASGNTDIVIMDAER